MATVHAIVQIISMGLNVNSQSLVDMAQITILVRIKEFQKEV